MVGLLLILLMIPWLLISIGVGRLVRKYIWHRRAAFWVVVILLNLAPWVRLIADATVARWSLYRLGVFVPEQPIEVRGFLNDQFRDRTNLGLEFYLGPPPENRGFEYVEIQYTTSVSGTPAERDGPGYYQFRLAGLDRAACVAMSPENIPNNIWRFIDRCYAFQRTDEPVSRYVYSFTDASLQLWPRVTTDCSRLTDLIDERHVAQYCTAGYPSWMGYDSSSTESFPVGVRRRLDIRNSLQPVQPHATEQNIQPE